MSTDSLRTHLSEVLAALRAVTPTDEVWPKGLMHPGGPHRRLVGMLSPISIGDDECLVLGRMIEGLRPKHGYVIGNAFGLSSAYLAKVMQACGGESLVTLDSQEEGDGARCAQVAERLRLQLGLRILQSKKGRSPEDVGNTVAVNVHDFVFIDGRHAHPDVTNDLLATLPYADERTVFLWHDFWIGGVPESVQVAERRGFRCVYLPTSCEMVLGVRDEAVYQRLVALYPEAQFTPFVHRNRERLGVFGRTVFDYAKKALRG